MSVKERLVEHCEEEYCGLDGSDRDALLSLIEAVEKLDEMVDNGLQISIAWKPVKISLKAVTE